MKLRWASVIATLSLLTSVATAHAECALVLWRMEARFKGVEFTGNCLFLGRPLLSIARGGRIQLGDGVRVCSAAEVSALDVLQANLVVTEQAAFDALAARVQKTKKAGAA